MAGVALDVEVVHVCPDLAGSVVCPSRLQEGFDSFVECERKGGSSLAAPLHKAIVDIDGPVGGGAVWDQDGCVDTLPEIVKETAECWARPLCCPQCCSSVHLTKRIFAIDCGEDVLWRRCHGSTKPPYEVNGTSWVVDTELPSASSKVEHGRLRVDDGTSRKFEQAFLEHDWSGFASAFI